MAEGLLGALRLAHALAALLWVGSAVVFALGAPSANAVLAPRLRDLLGVGVAVFVLSGTLLAAQRLSSAALPPSYAVVLAIKVGLGLWMFMLARKPRSGESRLPLSVNGQLAIIGVLIYALAIALRSIYEDAIRP